MLLGYALGKVPIYVNQTIGGAIATNTHGSSFTYSSLSNEVVGFRVVLANGTLTEIYPDRHPLYFRAFQVSVGRLGVVTDVKMRIIRETLVRRTIKQSTDREDFFSEIKEIQVAYASGEPIPEWIEGVTYFISFTTNITVKNPGVWTALKVDLQFSRWTFENLEAEERGGEITGDSHSGANFQATPPRAYQIISSPANACFYKSRSDIADGVDWTVPDPRPPNLNLSNPDLIASFVESSPALLLTLFGNVTGDTHEVELLTSAAGANEPGTTDDYEVGVPLEKLAECMDGFLNLAEEVSAETFFRQSLFVRFAGRESGLLSASHDRAYVWFQFEDNVFYNTECVIRSGTDSDAALLFRPRSSNLPLKQLIAHLVANESCSPSRLHWGKAGWPDFGCWNGAEHYKDTWCDFGCAVRALDPTDKFIGSAPDRYSLEKISLKLNDCLLCRWNWNGANLERCCTDEGYDTSLDGCGCNVIPIRTREECPEAPFYTNR